jgi:septal ring factor EnvC (AmiA/AmiB activator)
VAHAAATPRAGRLRRTEEQGPGHRGKAGDPVLAAADGRVVYAGAGLRGYGNLIILKHNNTYLTAYAHNQSLLVKEDQTVRKGQKIAEMGQRHRPRQAALRDPPAGQAGRSRAGTCRGSDETPQRARIKQFA